MSQPGAIATVQNANTGPFEEDAQRILRALHGSLGTVVEGIKPRVRRAVDLRRRLNLDERLAWSIYTAAMSRDVRAVASLLPGRRAMERFFVAAGVHGVSEAEIAQARSAYEAFEGFVADQAGSRASFESMVSGLGAGSDEPGAAFLKHKRAAFRANALMWGRQARVSSWTLIVNPSEGSDLVDLVFIKGLVGLHRTSRAVPLHTSYQRRTANRGDPQQAGSPEPLDPRESGPGALGLLRDFCSEPAPEFRIIDTEHGYRGHELMSDGLGPSEEVTFFIGEVHRAVGAVPGSVPGSEITIAKVVDVPLEAFTGDMFIHRSIWGTREPAVEVHSCPLDGSTEFRASDRLPLTERAEYMGDGIAAARNPLVPRYADLLSYAMGRMGWEPEEFRGFRCHVEYPVLSSRIRMTLG